MSKTKVKKALGELTREQLVEVLLDLYSARTQARDWLNFFAEPNTQTAKEKAIDAALKECRRSKWGRSRMRISVLNNLSKEFETLGVDTPDVIDLRLTICNFLCQVDSAFYLSEAQTESIKKYFVKTLEIALGAGTLPKVQARMQEMAEVARAGSALRRFLMDPGQNG